jgi:hypothetical protein
MGAASVDAAELEQVQGAEGDDEHKDHTDRDHGDASKLLHRL